MFHLVTRSSALAHLKLQALLLSRLTPMSWRPLHYITVEIKGFQSEGNCEKPGTWYRILSVLVKFLHLNEAKL